MDTPTGEKPTEPGKAAPTSPVVEPAKAGDTPLETKPIVAAVEPAKAEPAKAEPVVEPAKVESAKEPVKATAAPDAPVVYDLKGREGRPVDPNLMETMLPVLKEAGITPKAAQSLVDTFNAYQAKVLPQIMARDLESLRQDPELGKLNFGRTQARIQDALAAFTTPEERKTLTDMGLANNPALVRMFHRIGTAMQEPQQTDAGSQPRAPRSTGNKLYGGGDLAKN